MKTCLVAVNSNSVNNSFTIECGDVTDASFQEYSLSRGSIAGILTLDTVADYLPRRGPLKQRRYIFRLRLARLHFISEAVFSGFSSMNSSIGGAGAILVNRLAKQLFPYNVLAHNAT